MSELLLDWAGQLEATHAKRRPDHLGRPSKRHRKRAARLAALVPARGRLVQSLSEFFAARSGRNQLSRYSEIGGCEDNQQEEEDDKISSSSLSDASGEEDGRHHYHHHHHNDHHRAHIFPSVECIERRRSQQQRQAPSRPNSEPLSWLVVAGRYQREPPVVPLGHNRERHSRVKKFSGAEASQRKSSCAYLLGALFSGRRRASGFSEGPQTRAKLLARLLRLPAVLGALFSLSLVITLLVLYALSFYHCEHHSLRQSSSSDGHQLPSSLATGRHQKHKNQQQLHVNSRRHLGANSSSRGDSGEITAPSDLLVATECGKLTGRLEGEALVFRSVAYASPPVGARRWQRPRPIWEDANLCKRRNSSPPNGHLAEHCLQLSPFSQQKQMTGSEDCLYLDIFVPKSREAAKQGPGSQLPVMVYIHGGFLAFGSNGRPNNEMDNENENENARVNWLAARPSAKLAAELNVVLVAPNYRLQALGFMALDQLGGANKRRSSAAAAAGNYGLWDQLVALQWVQRNIGHFGGDANSVVLFGPDSASALPLALLARSGASEPVPFHAVWLSNPSVYFELEPEMARQHYERLIRSQSSCSPASLGGISSPTTKTSGNATEMELQTRRCLMGLSGEQIVREYLGKDDASYRLDDQNSLPIRNIFPDQFVDSDGELVEGAAFLSAQPHSSAAGDHSTSTDEARQHKLAQSDGGGNKLRLLIGSSAEAVEFWPCPRNLHAWNWDDFRKYVSASLNTFSPQIYARSLQVYRVTAPNETEPNNAYGALQDKQSEPAEVYLKMVSDIKQICPVNELVALLRSHEPNRLHISRYIVEQRPSEELARQLSSRLRTKSNIGHATNSSGDEKNTEFKYSFHYFDLLAFFGYENDVEDVQKLTKYDQEFQKQIRKMVRDFVWNSSTSTSANEHKYALLESGSSRRIEATSDYREQECQMWREALNGQSYAWLS